MLLIVTALLLVSTTAYGLGNLIGSLPIAVPVGPVLGRIVGWSISIVSAIVMFLLLYKILPNKPQSWRQALPGALLATVLFFVILQVFPLYLTIFGKGFQAYAAFGVFLLLMFWVFLLGIVLVLGAELNAFLEEPGRATALAETTAKAEKGQVGMEQQAGQVQTRATGSSAAGGNEPAAKPSKAGRPLFGPATPSETIQSRAEEPSANVTGGSARPTLAGKVLGFAALIMAMVMLGVRSYLQHRVCPRGVEVSVLTLFADRRIAETDRRSSGTVFTSSPAAPSLR